MYYALSYYRTITKAKYHARTSRSYDRCVVCQQVAPEHNYATEISPILN